MFSSPIPVRLRNTIFVQVIYDQVKQKKHTKKWQDSRQDKQTRDYPSVPTEGQ